MRHVVGSLALGDYDLLLLRTMTTILRIEISNNHVISYYVVSDDIYLAW